MCNCVDRYVSAYGWILPGASQLGSGGFRVALVITLAQVEALANGVNGECQASALLSLSVHHHSLGCQFKTGWSVKTPDTGFKMKRFKGGEKTKQLCFSFASGFETVLCTWVLFSSVFSVPLCKKKRLFAICTNLGQWKCKYGEAWDKIRLIVLSC